MPGVNALAPDGFYKMTPQVVRFAHLNINDRLLVALFQRSIFFKEGLQSVM